MIVQVNKNIDNWSQILKGLDELKQNGTVSADSYTPAVAWKPGSLSDVTATRFNLLYANQMEIFWQQQNISGKLNAQDSKGTKRGKKFCTQ